MSFMAGSKTPALPPPPPPPVKESNPDIIEAKRRAQFAERQRRGRSASVLSGGQGVTGEPTIDQPRAGAQILG